MGCVNSTPADETGVQRPQQTRSEHQNAPAVPANSSVTVADALHKASTNGLQASTHSVQKTSSSLTDGSGAPPPTQPVQVITSNEAATEKPAVATDAKTEPPATPVAPTQPQASQSPVAAPEAVNPTLKTLRVQDLLTVQTTLMKVSTLIQKFAEGKTDRTTPIQAIRRALELVVNDAHADFASVQVLSESADYALMAALVGGPDPYLDSQRLQRLGGSGLAAEELISTRADVLTWNPMASRQPPGDWVLLISQAGLRHLSAVPIRIGEKTIGILTLGFKEANEQYADHALWTTYLQLVASAMSSMVKDSTIPKYLSLVKEVYIPPDIDGIIHVVVSHMRGVLGHNHNHHTWYRIALTGNNNVAATIFDDLTQVPTPLMQRGLSSQAGNSSARLLKDVQAAGGVMRTVVAMKSTVMKISVHNRQQVMIPDVQKLINQSGNVSVDIFNTRLIKPPTSVLVFPLKVKAHIFGVVFCMSNVATDFSDVAPRLRELCEVMSPHLLVLLNTNLAQDYLQVQNATPSSQEGGSFSGLVLAASRNASFSGRSLGDSGATGLGLNVSSSLQSGDSFMFTQSRSSTGALVTGLTEKLNQKRIKSSMDFAGNQALGDLQIQSLLGEGGFAKVFKGLWRGLVVGIKVVCDDGKNEKMVMKNAHEIAILNALSHPNIVQAYTCLTDVLVRDLLTTSFRAAPAFILTSAAYKYLAGMDERPCHIEVIEFCDLGNLSTALKYNVFQVPHPDRVLAASVILSNKDNGSGSSDTSSATNPNIIAASALVAEARAQAGKVNMRTLLLTLIEIASAMSYLHTMGVVHCDIKPANILLRSSNIDSRGFTVKVSDFGLSRVEDDDTHASFPFNSCGTAAYVAPEALICNKKVNSSVDVYAFGILMWEMYTGARPYGNMKQQQLVEEVVMRGLRPRFPSHTPPSFVLLAQSCWSGSAQSRPTFEEALSTLNGMLTALDEKESGSSTGTSLLSSGDVMQEYIMPSPSAMAAHMQLGSSTHSSFTTASQATTPPLVAAAAAAAAQNNLQNALDAVAAAEAARISGNGSPYLNMSAAQQRSAAQQNMYASFKQQVQLQQQHQQQLQLQQQQQLLQAQLNSPDQALAAAIAGNLPQGAMYGGGAPNQAGVRRPIMRSVSAASDARASGAGVSGGAYVAAHAAFPANPSVLSAMSSAASPPPSRMPA